jgi:hypothetical protein
VSNKFQLKRTSVSGRTPNTTNSSNSSFIDAGELAVNLADQKLFSSNGVTAFEVGSNLSSLSVTGTTTLNAISANGTPGDPGQVLTSNGSTVYWAEPTGGGGGSVQLYTYTYTINANTTVITGLDDASHLLSYTANLESVYVNGVKIVSGVDYATTNASAITLQSNAVSGDVIQIVAASSYTNIVGQQTSANTPTTANTVVDTFDKTVFRTAKYLIQIKANSQFHATEVLVMHDNTTAYLTEYATIFSNNDLGNVYANVNGANVELIVSPLYSNSTINTVRITLGV